MLKILHLGDMHLCSAFSAFSPRAAATRRARQFEALEKTVDRAREMGAQMLLLAGDCFDTQTPDADAVRRFFSLLGDSALPTLIAPGNHDYYRAGGFWDSVPLPQNVHLFRENAVTCVRFPALDTVVYGYAFTDEVHDAPALPRRDELLLAGTSILLAHADLLSPLSPYAPIASGALAASGFTYAALGHVHNPPEPRRFGDTLAAYSGFLTGRGFDETGAGRANFVEIEGLRVKITPLEVEGDRFEIRTLDCTGIPSGEALRAHVADFLKGEALPDGTALRLILSGEVSEACTPDTVALSRLGEGLALFEVRDGTIPLYDADFLEKDQGLRGAFYRAMEKRLHSQDPAERELAAKALRFGFAALSGREIL